MYRSELGKRTMLNDVVIPPTVAAGEVATYLDDIFHEFAWPGETVELMPDQAFMQSVQPAVLRRP